MDKNRIKLVGIGNAIVDVLSKETDSFLKSLGMTKGGMALIDEDQAQTIYAAMGPGIEISGGSAANTIAGFAALGGTPAFIGKVKQDQLGAVFAHDIRSSGVHYETAAAGNGAAATARCLVLITPDAQRTMNTFLGASQGLTEADIDEALIARADITYLEGYLWDPPEAKKAFLKAMEIAKANGRKVALTLSDAFCVDRYRDEFIDLVENKIDILFANEAEIISLYEAKSFDDALECLGGKVDIAAVTRSEKGSIVIGEGKIIEIPAAPVAHVVDTTGAGDLYAAGFLHGLAYGHDLEIAGRLGSLCAAEIISHVGARPEADLKELAKGLV